MSYIPVQPVNINLTEIVNLLEMNAACCEMNTKYLIDINNRLNKYEFIFRELLNCCNRPGNTGVIIDNPIGVLPGQIVSPPLGSGNTGVIIDRPIRQIKQIREVVYESYDTPFYPKSSVIDIPGEFKIIDNKYVDKSGTDLKRYLPYELNIKNDNIILEAILDYRILIGGGLYPRQEVILIYQTKNVKTGAITTFEAGVNHYRKWYEIHYGRKVN
jgi:hypothetical protein